MSALRVYLKRGDHHLEGGFLRRLFKQPLATHLLRQALKHGVTHASVHLAHTGYTRGAVSIDSDLTDLPVRTLPICLELVAPRRLLEQFVRDHEDVMPAATLVMLDGARVALAEDGVSAAIPHHVDRVGAAR